MSEQPSFKDLGQQKKNGIASDLLHFMKHNKKWWLAPFLIIFLIMGLLVVLSGTGAAPFVYTLF